MMEFLLDLFTVSILIFTDSDRHIITHMLLLEALFVKCVSLNVTEGRKCIGTLYKLAFLFSGKKIFPLFMYQKYL